MGKSGGAYSSIHGFDRPLVIDGFNGAFRTRGINGIKLELYGNFIDGRNNFRRRIESKKSIISSDMSSFIMNLIELCSTENKGFKSLLLGLRQNGIIISDEVKLMDSTLFDFKDALLALCKKCNIDYNILIRSLIVTGHLPENFCQLVQG